MSHVVVLARGEKFNFERFFTELSTRYLTYPMYNKETGKMEEKRMNVRVSPIQLFDISFPEEHRDVILNTLFSGDNGRPINKFLNKFIFGLRKMMHLKPLPEFSKKEYLSMYPPEHVEMIAIGVKDDYWIEPDGRHVAKKDKSPLATEGI